jgi:hypothetical protein
LALRAFHLFTPKLKQKALTRTYRFILVWA